MKGGTLAIVRTMVESPSPLYTSTIAAKCGLTPDAVGKSLSNLLRKGMVSRTKPKDTPEIAYNKWFVTVEQHRLFLSKCVGKTVMNKDMEKKLAFLRRVRENPLYADNPMLNMIIDDYKFVSPAEEVAHG